MIFLSKIFPFYTKMVEKMAIYVNLKKDSKEHANNLILIAIIFGLAGFGALYYLTNWIYGIIAFFALFIIVLLIFYTLFVLKADRIAKEAENALPDALQLMATNLRSGLTTDRAFIVSAREDFGRLNIEFKRVAKEIATGEDLTESLSAMSKRIKSNIVARTIDLVNFGIISGGELASLLEESAASLRQQLLTRKQIHSSVLMYTIFIFAAVGFISPLLFSLSTVLTEIITSTLSGIDVIPPDVSSKVPLTVSQVIIDVGFIRIFSLILLGCTSVLSSLALGLINSGEEKDGLRYIPILLALSIAMFFIVSVGIRFALSYFVTG